MKAELRASLIYDFLQMHGDDPSEPFRDFVTVQIEIAEQQARKETLDLLREIRDWDTEQTMIYLKESGRLRFGLPLHLRKRLVELALDGESALIEREAQ